VTTEVVLTLKAVSAWHRPGGSNGYLFTWDTHTTPALIQGSDIGAPNARTEPRCSSDRPVRRSTVPCSHPDPLGMSIRLGLCLVGGPLPAGCGEQFEGLIKDIDGAT
jgi:hypothetical protein